MNKGVESGEPKDISWLRNFLKKLQEQKFYGTIDLKFQKGKIVSYSKTETGKPT